MTRRADPLIGLDVGSTHVKAVLVRPGAGVAHVARRATITHHGRGGAAELHPDEVLAASEAVIAECAAAAAPDRVAGIGIAGMAEAGAMLGRNDQPLGPILAWFDPRPAGEAAALEREIGAERLFATTGLRPEAKYTLPKLVWLRANRAAAYRRLRHWSGVPELVARSLGAELTTNASLACRTMAFDVAERRWDEQLLGLAGLEIQQMPRVVPLGAPAGGLSRAAAGRVEVAAGTPIAVAGHDHVVGAIGAGVAAPGRALDSMGSAEVALLVTQAPMPSEPVRLAGFSTGCHAADGLGYVLGGLQASGALVEWFIDAFMPPHEADRGAGYEAFVALLDRAPAGPGPLLVRPYLRGRTAPSRDPSATFDVAAMRAEHGLPELALGIVEAAAYHVRWMFEELVRVSGVRLERLTLVGGGARNGRWLATKAALGPWTIEVARTEEAVALGAALVGGIAGGVYGSLDAALADAAPSERAVRPASERRRYRAAYEERWLPWVRSTAV